MSPLNYLNVEQPLTGKELLKRVKELGELNKSEKAKACGYVSQSSSGQERAKLSEFMNALIEAQGIQLDSQSDRGRGRSLSYRASVQQNGTIVIGPGYTREMGLEHGDCFEIKLGRKSLKLTAIDSDHLDATEFNDFAHEEEEFDSDEID